MSLYCPIDADGDYEWWWMEPKPEAPLSTKRSRKCCSCKTKIKVGGVSRKVDRYRRPTEWEEDKGFCLDEVPLASWFLCETCGDLYDSITELGFCCELGSDSLAKQIKDYNEENKPWRSK